jgi:hypothetical protein
MYYNWRRCHTTVGRCTLSPAATPVDSLVILAVDRQLHGAQISNRSCVGKGLTKFPYLDVQQLLGH